MRRSISSLLLRQNEDIVALPKERAVLDIVRKQPNITRQSLSEKADLPRQTGHRIVESLTDRNLLVISAQEQHGRGQLSPLVNLTSDNVFSLGISVNTDTATLILSNLKCEVIAERSLATTPLSRDVTLSKLERLLKELLTENNIEYDQILGIGFAIAGYFTQKDHVVNAPEPLKDWSSINLQKLLGDYFNLPIWLKNNASTAAVGESLVGAGLTYKNFGYLAFNYGFGGGIIIDGKPYFGANGNAGELSALYSPSTVEQRPALNMLVEVLQSAGRPVTNIRELNENFDPMWPEVDQWVTDVIPQLNLAMNSLFGILDPEAIVFGGEIPSVLSAKLIDHSEFWQQGRYGQTMPQPKLITSSLKHDPAALGAALIPLKDCYFL